MQISYRLITLHKCRRNSGTIYPVIQTVQLAFRWILTFTNWSSKYEEIKKNKNIFAFNSSWRHIPFKYQRFIFSTGSTFAVKTNLFKYGTELCNHFVLKLFKSGEKLNKYLQHILIGMCKPLEMLMKLVLLFTCFLYAAVT